MKAKNFFIALFILSAIGSNGQISGTVFRDFNGNGEKDNTINFNEIGVAGVTVRAFNSSGIQVGGTQTTDVNGAYSFTGLTLPVRLEFTGVLNTDFSAPQGTGNNTSVQFITTSTTSANFGINYPGHYCETDNPEMVVPCYVNLAYDHPANGELDALVGFSYNYFSESPDNNTVIYTPSAPNKLAKHNEIGTTWGIAYDKERQRFFTAAVARRHAGFGPLGSSGIYYFDNSMASPTLEGSFDLGSLLPTTPDPRTATSFPDPNGSSQASRDPEIFPLIGKIAFGDIEMSEDNSTLYVMNLTDRNVYGIDVTGLPTAPGAADITTFTITDPGCSNGEFRPWALKAHRGELYAGVVCSAETSQDRADLKAYVMKLSGTSFIPFIGPIDLTYRKGRSGGGKFPLMYQFNPWVNDWATFDAQDGGDGVFDGGETGYPTAILADIEFDVDESIILGFLDRTGIQLGTDNLSTVTGDNNLYSSESGGDIRRICFVNGTYIIEGDDNTACPQTPDGTNFGAEYYTGDNMNGTHKETAQGGLALLAGTDQIATVVMNPVRTNSGGIQWFTNSDGTRGRGYEIFRGGISSGLFNKSTGLGDIEIFCAPPPIEIGNRVWLDTDSDGIQDAGETPIAGITVQLVKNGTVIATATTDANGNYYFSSGTGTNTSSVIYGISQLMPNMEYIVRIPNVQGGSKQAALGTNSLTTANADGTTNGDLRDSDGLLVGDNAEVTVMTTDIAIAGANNHTFDFGFSTGPPCPTPNCYPTTVVKN